MDSIRNSCDVLWLNSKIIKANLNRFVNAFTSLDADPKGPYNLWALTFIFFDQFVKVSDINDETGALQLVFEKDEVAAMKVIDRLANNSKWD